MTVNLLAVGVDAENRDALLDALQLGAYEIVFCDSLDPWTSACPIAYSAHALLRSTSQSKHASTFSPP